MSKLNKKHRKELKRKNKRHALKLASLPVKIEQRRRIKEKKAEYKRMVEENNKAINRKLKEALGIPLEEEVSTEKLVEAVNLRNKQEKEKRDKEAKKEQK